MTPRSYLYVPTDRPALLEKATQRGSDALILDLEDGVAESAKADARTQLSAWLGDASGPELWVRVSQAHLLEDLDVAVQPSVTGIYLAKAEDREQIDRLDREISRLEDQRGLAPGAIRVAGLIETAAGVLNAREIASGPRVRMLGTGEADLAADTGLMPSDDDREWWPIRTQIVLASAAAAIDPPVGPVPTDFRDLSSLAASTGALRRAGFGARAGIHPEQIPVINDVFTPSADEVEAARRLIDRYDTAVAAGRAIILDDTGRMVDEAVVRSARRTLDRATRQ